MYLPHHPPIVSDAEDLGRFKMSVEIYSKWPPRDLSDVTPMMTSLSGVDFSIDFSASSGVLTAWEEVLICEKSTFSFLKISTGKCDSRYNAIYRLFQSPSH